MKEMRTNRGAGDSPHLLIQGDECDDAFLIESASARPEAELLMLFNFGTGVTDEGIGRALAMLPNVRYLSINRAPAVRGAFLSALVNLQGLIHLDLGESGIDDTHLHHLAKLDRLTTLCTNNQAITDAGLSFLPSMRGLTKFLSLGLTQATDSLAESIAQTVPARSMNFRATRMTDAGLRAITRGLPRTTLNLMDLPLTDSSVCELASMVSLRALSLGGTAITDKSMFALSRLPNLEHLSFDRTKVTDAGLAALDQCPKLNHVTAEDSCVSRPALERLWDRFQREYLAAHPEPVPPPEA